MNATQKAQNAYRSNARTAKTPRDTEYDAFARITSRLKTSASLGKKGFNELAAALHDNRKLWTILTTDVVSAANPLPKELKARIVFLSEFTRQHSTKVLKRQASVLPLIEINVAIMRGLRQPAAANANSSQHTASVRAQNAKGAGMQHAAFVK